jgi:hypothetical protein
MKLVFSIATLAILSTPCYADDPIRVVKESERKIIADAFGSCVKDPQSAQYRWANLRQVVTYLKVDLLAHRWGLTTAGEGWQRRETYTTASELAVSRLERPIRPKCQTLFDQ